MQCSRALRWMLSLSLLLATSLAQAADGRIEINHAAVLAGGLSAGDAPGYPATLDTAGSYVLTGHLDGTTSSTNEAIVIDADDVTLDLNGFSISCSGACAARRGILSSGARTRVTNGVVRDFGSSGVVLLSIGGRVSDVRASDNGAIGISVGWRSAVVDCITNNNGTAGGHHGILAGRYTVLRGNVSTANGGNGLSAGTGATIQGNSASENAGDGINCGASCLVSENSTYFNAANGIFVSTASLVSNNSSYNNGDDEIEGSFTAQIIGNAVRQLGGGAGIRGGSSSGYKDNVISSSGGLGPVVGGVNLGNNLCNGSLCP